MNRLLTLSLAVPLALAGCQIGHEVGNSLAGSPTGAEGELLQGPEVAVGAVGILAVAIGVGLAACVAWTVCADARLVASRVPFVLLAPVVFVFQEYLEYHLESGGASVLVLAHPATLVGLAAQVPVAAIAYLVARLLLGIVDRVAGSLRRHVTPVPPAGERLAPAISPRRTLRRPVVQPSRGPPALGASAG